MTRQTHYLKRKLSDTHSFFPLTRPGATTSVDTSPCGELPARFDSMGLELLLELPDLDLCSVKLILDSDHVGLTERVSTLVPT